MIISRKLLLLLKKVISPPLLVNSEESKNYRRLALVVYQKICKVKKIYDKYFICSEQPFCLKAKDELVDVFRTQDLSLVRKGICFGEGK